MHLFIKTVWTNYARDLLTMSLYLSVQLVIYIHCVLDNVLQ